ncbi:TerD family protein, partial [Streptomyces sp. NPDC000963]
MAANTRAMDRASASSVMPGSPDPAVTPDPAGTEVPPAVTPDPAGTEVPPAVTPDPAGTEVSPAVTP